MCGLFWHVCGRCCVLNEVTASTVILRFVRFVVKLVFGVEDASGGAEHEQFDANDDDKQFKRLRRLQVHALQNRCKQCYNVFRFCCKTGCSSRSF